MYKTNGTHCLMKREMFLRDLHAKLYATEILMKPVMNNILLSSSRHTNVVFISSKEMVLHMVLNKSLFSLQNLRVNLKDPYSYLFESIYVGEVNIGTWMKYAQAKECTLLTHILMLFCHLINDLNINKYEKLTVEAVLIWCIWFNRKARNSFV